MFRTWLGWGLTSTLLYTACGSGSENELFGNVKPGNGGTVTSIDPSSGETGGSTGGLAVSAAGRAATGGRDAGSAGENGSPAATGGHDSGMGGASTPGGVPGEPSSGASDSGGAGESPGGAASGTGGVGGASGGSETGGHTTGGTSGGTTGGNATGGNATGGATGGHATGGTATGGTTGGSTTGGSGPGGAGACAVARAQLQKHLIEAQECDPDSRAACRTLVSDECECNNVPVGDPLSDATSLYLDQLERVREACGPINCVSLLCTDVTGHCSPRNQGAGRCVALINTPSPDR